MSWLSDIEKIDRSKIAISLIVFMATVAPGFLILFLFKPDLIEKLDIVKLIIFSFSLTLPIIVVNFFLLVMRFTDYVQDQKGSNNVMFGSVTISIIAYYSAIFTAYINMWVFQRFIWWLLGIDLGLIVLVSIVAFFVSSKRKKK